MKPSNALSDYRYVDFQSHNKRRETNICSYDPARYTKPWMQPCQLGDVLFPKCGWYESCSWFSRIYWCEPSYCCETIRKSITINVIIILLPIDFIILTFQIIYRCNSLPPATTPAPPSFPTPLLLQLSPPPKLYTPSTSSLSSPFSQSSRLFIYSQTTWHFLLQIPISRCSDCMISQGSLLRIRPTLSTVVKTPSQLWHCSQKNEQ